MTAHFLRKWAVRMPDRKMVPVMPMRVKIAYTILCFHDWLSGLMEWTATKRLKPRPSRKLMISIMVLIVAKLRASVNPVVHAQPIRIFYLTVNQLSITIQYNMKRDNEDADEAGWEYGDVWKQDTPDELNAEAVQYVEILRGDMGMAYDDSYMLDLVTFLGSRGVRATYDSVSLGLEFGAGGMTTYVLKVEAGKEDEAREYLQEKFNVQGS
jgi:hypothetical protein